MRRYTKSIVFITMLLACFLCLSPASFSQGYEIIWKSGSLVPKGVGYASQINDILVPGILDATEGKLYLKTYYGGIMGDDEDVLKKVHIGQLQAAGSGVQLALLVCPEMGVTNLPFLFGSYDEVDHVRKAMYPVFDELMQDRGLKLLLWLDQGFDQIYSVNHPLANLEEFKKAKFITWCGDIETAFFETMGATAFPVNVPEFNTTIRQGLADAYIGPPIWAVSTQMYSVIRYINNTNIRYSPAVFFVSMEAWEALPEKYQDSIMEKREGWQTPFIEGSRADNKKCLDAMFNYGVQEITMPPAVLKDLKNRTRHIYDDMVDKVYPREVLDQTLDLLEEYRSQN